MTRKAYALVALGSFGARASNIMIESEVAGDHEAAFPTLTAQCFPPGHGLKVGMIFGTGPIDAPRTETDAPRRPFKPELVT